MQTPETLKKGAHDTSSWPAALSIAGSDPSGGAGIQADLKTFQAAGVYGTAVITLLTVQNTLGVKRVEVLKPAFVAEQVEAVLEDIPPAAAKTGALGNQMLVEAVACQASRFSFPLVVDPVMISKHGAPLLDKKAVKTLRDKLLPEAFLVTPNLPEAEILSEVSYAGASSLREMADAIMAFGVPHVLIKGGHREGDAEDVLFSGREESVFPGRRIETPHTHGTGCVFSAAITAELAKGTGLLEAVRKAKIFIEKAIADNFDLGRGRGPVNGFVPYPA